MAASQSGPTGQRREGFFTRGLVIALIALVPVLAIAWPVLSSFSVSNDEAMPMMHEVKRGEFIHEITDSGNVESASNVDIRCEVKSKGSAGTVILEVVPEGTYVKPGDTLVKFDSSALEIEQIQQQIICANSEADVIQARNVLESAEIALQEYLEGQYLLDLQAIQSRIILAKEDQRRAQQYYEYSKMLARKGYITEVQLEADKFAVDKADMELSSAETERKVLEQFTKEKMTKQLEADVKTAEAKFKAIEDSHKLDVERLEEIKTQIANCTLVSEETGQVVYANVDGGRGRQEIIIEEGATVREGQTVIRLPDPKRMQVVAKINESRVSLVDEGMPATIRLDAFPDVELDGVVEKVNDYPAPTSWYSANIKENETTVRIQEPPPGMRPGLTAEVKIEVERLTDVVQVPVQTALEHGDKYYCVAHDGDRFVPLEVQIGSTNDKFVVIEKGLEPGQLIAANATALRDKIELPDLPPEEANRNGRPRPSQKPDGAADQGEQPAPGKSNPGAAASKMFQQLDTNGDGRLESSEIPEKMAPHLKSADTNGDGAVDRGEFAAAAARMVRQQGGGGSPGGPAP